MQSSLYTQESCPPPIPFQYLRHKNIMSTVEFKQHFTPCLVLRLPRQILNKGSLANFISNLSLTRGTYSSKGDPFTCKCLSINHSHCFGLPFFFFPFSCFPSPAFSPPPLLALGLSFPAQNYGTTIDFSNHKLAAKQTCVSEPTHILTNNNKIPLFHFATLAFPRQLNLAAFSELRGLV